jgi:hypothetical protein
MRDKFRCYCHICKVERALVVSLSDPDHISGFSRLRDASPIMNVFSAPAAIVDHLHNQSDARNRQPTTAEVLGALIQTGISAGTQELVQSILVLAFIPTIHRTYWEVRAWFRELETEDIAQQVFALFLQLTASAPVEMLNRHISFVLAQALHRNAIRWARQEQSKLLERERMLELGVKPIEQSEEPHFESVSLLREFLDHSVRVGILSEFERDLLVRVKVDGFSAKEVLERHTVLSPKAVYVRIQRIMKRLQDAAWDFPGGNQNSAKRLEPIESEGRKHFSKIVSTFSLSTFPGDAAISVSRRQLPPENSPEQTTKSQQFPTLNQDSLIRFETLTPANERPRAIREATSRRLAATRASGSAIV